MHQNLSDLKYEFRIIKIWTKNSAYKRNIWVQTIQSYTKQNKIKHLEIVSIISKHLSYK
jgi:hypothetical protein